MLGGQEVGGMGNAPRGDGGVALRPVLRGTRPARGPDTAGEKCLTLHFFVIL